VSADKAVSGNPEAASLFTFTVKPWDERHGEHQTIDSSSRRSAKTSPKLDRQEKHDADMGGTTTG